MRALLIVLAIALLGLYVWGIAAYWQAASRERLKLLQIMVVWNILAAVASLFFLLAAARGEFDLLGLIGAGFAIATPFLWQLGRVGRRLGQYGLSYGRIYMFGS